MQGFLSELEHSSSLLCMPPGNNFSVVCPQRGFAFLSGWLLQIPQSPSTCSLFTIRVLAYTGYYMHWGNFYG